MSSTEVEERGRQFDATLDVDHSGVAERRLVINIFIFPNEGLLIMNHERDKLKTKGIF